MAGIFPFSQDGGLPPNALQPNNPAQAFPPTVLPADTSALYYGNGCDVRLRPAVVNSLISEIAATSDRAMIPYRASSLQNLETAARYLIQRGLPRSGLMIEQTETNYAVLLDPPLTAYTDLLTLTLLPQMQSGATQNSSYVRVNVNSQGYVPLLRNDRYELKRGDLIDGIPLIVAYYDGAFYVVGFVNSQVPISLTGTVDGWVRTDGNDITGDGSANSPDKAFRTIAGAYNAIASRYAASSMLTMVIRIGIPGTYEGAAIGPFSGAVYIVGDLSNPTPYKIGARYWTHYSDCIEFQSIAGYIEGVHLLADHASDLNDWTSLRSYNASTWAVNCNFEMQFDVIGGFARADYGGLLSFQGPHNFYGNGHSMHYALFADTASLPGTGILGPATLNFANCVFIMGGFCAANLGSIANTSTTVTQSGCTGPRYNVQDNSVIRAVGQTLPGNANGTTSENGLFIP